MAYLKPQSPLKNNDDYIYPLTTADQVIMEDGSRLNKLATPKAGFIYPLASDIVPEGFLLCDGAEYLRAEYPELFAVIGTMYGAGDGSTTFNVPNLQNNTVVNYIIATGKNAGVSVTDIITGTQALPLDIEYGGTGATNAATARANLGITPENIGAMSMDLLWENASPSSEFAQKEISVPGLSNYKMIVIETARGTFFRNNNVGYLYMSGAVSWSAGDSTITSRVAEIRNSSILFISGYVVNVLDRIVQKSDNEFVPVRIYGIKGVL